MDEERRQEALARERNRQVLMNVAEQHLIVNDEEIECKICFTDCAAGDGVKLRECLHMFCRLVSTAHSDVVEARHGTMHLGTYCSLS